MNLKSIFGLVILLILGFCTQQSSKDGFLKRSGLQIENRINRGIQYTDSLGRAYSIRYIPVAITNDTSLPILLQIDFSRQYEYTVADSTESFKILPLPKEWAMEGVEVTEAMIQELPNYMHAPSRYDTIAPGEQTLIGIASIYPSPSKLCGILPKTLFVQEDTPSDSTCEQAIPANSSNTPQLNLSLQLNFCGNCMILSCGQIAYLER